MAREEKPKVKPAAPRVETISTAVSEPAHLAPPAEEPVIRDLSLEDQKDPRPSMWRSLLQLRVLIPYVSRLLPLLDSGFAAPHDTRHFDQGVAEVQSGHRELSQLVQDQSAQMKRVEEQVTRLRESFERNATDMQDIVEEVRVVGKAVRLMGILALALLVVLIGLVSYVAFR